MRLSYEEIMTMARETELPFAYDHFAEGESPDPPFLLFLFPRSSNFGADGGVYFKTDVLHFELYTDAKDPELEDRIETVFDRHGLFYNKSEVWVADERLYEVLYEMGVTHDEQEQD